MQKDTVAEPLRVTIGRNIRRWREFKELSGENLAQAVGLSEGSISNYENGRTDFTTERIEQFAKALELTPSQLMLSDPQSIITFTQNSIHNGVNYGTQHTSIDKELLIELRQQLKVKDEQLHAKDRQIEFLQQSFAAR